MAQWHAQIGGQRYGPVSEEEMKSWIAQGRVSATDFVWSEGMPNWVAAGAAFAQATGAIPPIQAARQIVYVAPLPPPPGTYAAFFCGLFSVFFPCLGLVLGIIAVINAKKARAALAADPSQYAPGSGGLTTAGQILGIIGIVVGVLIALGAILLFARRAFPDAL
jgi:hypothetical protein